MVFVLETVSARVCRFGEASLQGSLGLEVFECFLGLEEEDFEGFSKLERDVFWGST